MKTILLYMHLPDGAIVEAGCMTLFEGDRSNTLSIEADEQFLPGASGYWQANRLPEVLNDALPDSFGAKIIALMDRRLSRRSGNALSLLMHTNDTLRLGALRMQDNGIWISHESPYDAMNQVSPQKIIQATSQAFKQIEHADDNIEQHIMRLLASISGSAGGARPKIMLNLPRPAIIKFPRDNDIQDISLVEHNALLTLSKAGGSVSQTRRLKIPEYHHQALCVYRFDRTDTGRVPMISGRTAADLIDPRAADENNSTWEDRISYEHLALFLQMHGAEPEADIEALYRLAIVNAITGNTDNHLKNHAFLWTENGWRLSPAFDLVPQPLFGKASHKLAFFFDRSESVVSLQNKQDFIRFASRLEISSQTALEITERVEMAVAQQNIAGESGSEEDIDLCGPR